jgi:hypothetical protein
MKTVGIGSLPHKSIHDAVKFSIRHDMPFLPQMTSLGERMIPQVKSSKKLSEKYSSLSLFTEKLLETNTSFFKIQIAGPETCNTNESIILKEIENFLEYFEQFKLKPIVFIDEPVITMKSASLKNIFKELRSLDIITGLHSCASFDCTLVDKLETDYLSFDLGVISSAINSNKILIAGLPPFSEDRFKFTGDWISSSCGLAMYTENQCETILKNLKIYK